jgi:hypothetical protein
MKPWRFATMAAVLCRMEVLPACAIGLLAAWGSVGIETRGTSPIMNRIAPALAADADAAMTPRPRTIDNAVAAKPELALASDSISKPTEQQSSREIEPLVASAATDSTPKQPTEPPPVQVGSLEPEPTIVAVATDTTEKPPSETAPVQVAALEPSAIVEAATSPTEKLSSETPPVPADPVRETKLNSVEIFDECYAADVCIDRYLWALYERTPKEDSIKVQEQHKVTVKRKGKMVTVTRTSTRVVDEDFAWKDPKAADKSSMSMMDYVIGGMDRNFKLKLFRVLRAAEAAGLSPGITSAFRDDYRQSIAAGLKAANDRSYHGGSFRGGYGHGLAADIVSVNGATRAQRQASSESLWKWVDTHGREYGVGRPYLDRDPPHVGPIDGNEYISRRGTKPQEAKSGAEKHKRVATRDERSVTKRVRTAKSS